MAQRLLSLYETAACEQPTDPALIIADEDGPRATYSWSELWDLASAQAGAMADAGIPERTLVAVEGSQTELCLASFLAVWQRGGTVVPVDPQWGTWLAKQILEHAVAAGYVDAAGNVASRNVTAPEVGDWAVISYTSGTTGNPKGVILGHEQLLHAYMAGATELSRVVGAIPKRIACSMRVSGMGVIGIHHFWAALMRATLVIVPELNLFTAASYWDVMVRERADLTYLVPPLVALLERAGQCPERGILPVCLAGGAPLSAELQRRFQERFKTQLFNYYGLTEVGFTAFFGSRAAGGLASAEIGLPGTVLARLRNTDGTIVIEAEGSGELELAGPALALGYYKNERGWREVVSDGWLSTGDIATRSSEGLYRISGRAKDAVMRGGFVIYLHEIETATLEMPEVIEAGALILKGSDEIEDVGLVVRSQSHPLGPDGLDVRDALVKMLGTGRAPRRVLVVDEPLPRISQGKLDRRALAVMWDRLTEREKVVP